MSPADETSAPTLRELDDVRQEAGLRGGPRRRGREHGEHDRGREREHDHARREAEEAARGCCTQSTNASTGGTTKCSRSSWFASVSYQLRRPEPEVRLEPLRRDDAEERLLEPELRAVERVRREHVREAAHSA